MFHRRQICLVGTSFAATCVLLTGLSAHPQSQSADNTLRVTTRLVNVNAVVTDALGNPLKDLTEDDFVILDGGQPQKITFFSVVDNTRPPAVASLPGPDTYTNRPADYGALPNSTILLFDTLNSRWTTQGYGLHRVRKFLRQVEPRDHLGVYVLGDDLKILHNFSRDASDLVEAIRRYDEEHVHPAVKSAHEEEDRGDPLLDRFLSGKDNRYRFELDPRTAKGPYRLDKLAFAFQMTITSLEGIARQLASIEGRKTLIWVTDRLDALGIYDAKDINDIEEYLQGLSIDTGLKLPGIPAWENVLDIERLIRLMSAAGIAVYTVDARGLETVDLDFHNTMATGKIGSNAAPVTDLLARTPEPSPALLELASRTGGRAFFNRNDLETGIRRAEDDARFTYNLAYTPDHGLWKGEWRKIQVKVNRPGVTVLARGGYFALPDARPVPPKNLFQFYGQIAGSPIESTQLPLSVHIATSRGPQGAKIDAHVHLDPQPMLTLQGDGNWTGGFEVMFMQIGARNKLLDATKKEVHANLTQQEYENASKNGWDLPAQLKFMPGAKLLCVILHDKSTDAAGSVRIPLDRYSAPPH